MRLVYLTLGWVAGIVLVEGGDAHVPLVWLGLLTLATGGAWLNRRSNWRWLSFAVVALALGGLRASFLPTTSDVARYNDRGGLTLTGPIVVAPDVRDDVILIRIRAESVTRGGLTRPTDGNVLVRAPSTAPVAYGDRVQVTGLLTTPGTFDNFSYADYLQRWGVYSVMRQTAVEVVERGGGNPLYAWLLQQKNRAADTINQSMPEPMAGLLVGILLGNERGLSPALEADFAATGAAHIVAISGFNMVILAGVVESLLAQTPLRRLWVGVISVAFIAVYTVFVGANAAVVRAAVMSGVLVIGRAIGRRTYVPASLAFVALIMSAIQPRVLWSISFQLSFFATLGLALFADPLTRRFDAVLRRLFPRRAAADLSDVLSEPLIVTVAALIPTLPLTALYFSRVSLVQLPVNLLIVPVQAVVLISGILATLVNIVAPPVAQVIYWFDMALLWWSVTVVRRFADLPFADVSYYVDGAWIIGFFGILIVGAMLHATRPLWLERLMAFVGARAVLSTTVLVGVVLAGLNVALWQARPDGNLHVYVLDVGHSNGIFVQTPGGAQILIDGGRYPSRLLTQIGDRMPFNDRHIEVVAVTQPDVFQYGALPAVLSRYSIGAALTNGQPNQSDAFAELQTALAPYPVVEATTGYQVTFDDGTQLDVLAPPQAPTLVDNLDDGVLVLRLRYGDASFLFTSDLSIAGQTALLASEAHPVARVLQLPQHGGARSLSEEFLAQVQPQVALLQSDPANRLGDPSADTLALLPADMSLFRTDEQGIIHIETDGQTLWVR